MQAYPLHWPLGRKITSPNLRTHSAFKTTLGKARDTVIYHLEKMRAKSIIISSNINTYNRGGQEIMYADQSKAKEHPGVAVYFFWKSKEYSLSCDKYKTVCDNLQAIAKTLEAIRGIERWGTGDMMEAAFSGFKMLPEATESEPWYQVLGISQLAYPDEIKAAYKAKVMQSHPDKGESVDLFNKVQKAYKEGLARFS